jgi:hypothetical protein
MPPANGAIGSICADDALGAVALLEILFGRRFQRHLRGPCEAHLRRGDLRTVISGTTITPKRSAIVLFSQPCLEFNQGIAVNKRADPTLTWPIGLFVTRSSPRCGFAPDPAEAT